MVTWGREKPRPSDWPPRILWHKHHHLNIYTVLLLQQEHKHCNSPWKHNNRKSEFVTHHKLLSHDQLWAASLIGRNTVTWSSSLSNDERVGGQPCDTALLHGHVSTHHCKLAQLISNNMWSATAVLTVSKSQNVKDRSHANKYLRKIEVNLQTKADICISTYSNADVVCYRTTWRMELYDSCLIVKKS